MSVQFSLAEETRGKLGVSSVFPCIWVTYQRTSLGMGRQLRPNDEGLVYHAINRGNNREVVFDDDDFLAFLHGLGRTQLRYPFRLYGYCPKSNHFHLLLRPDPATTISRILQSLTAAHTWRYHRRHHTLGHVWQGRFNNSVRDAALMWMAHAGVGMTNSFAVACELQRGWRNNMGGLGTLLANHLPSCKNMMTNFNAKAIR